MKLDRNNTVTLEPQVSTGYSYGGEVQIVVRCNGDWAVVDAEAALEYWTCGTTYNNVFVPDPDFARRLGTAAVDLSNIATAAIGADALRSMRKVGGCVPEAIRGMKTVISP